MIRPAGITLVLVAALATTAPARPVQEHGDRDIFLEIDLQHPLPPSPGRSSVFLTAAQGTTYYGGTVWAADSARWEALEDSVWTFDSGVGSDLVGSSGNPGGLRRLLRERLGPDQHGDRHPDRARVLDPRSGNGAPVPAGAGDHPVLLRIRSALFGRGRILRFGLWRRGAGQHRAPGRHRGRGRSASTSSTSGVGW